MNFRLFIGQSTENVSKFISKNAPHMKIIILNSFDKINTNDDYIYLKEHDGIVVDYLIV